MRLRWLAFLGFNLVAAGLAVLARSWVLSAGGRAASLARAAVVELVLFMAYWLVLRHLGIAWVDQIEQRMVHPSAELAASTYAW